VLNHLAKDSNRAMNSESLTVSLREAHKVLELLSGEIKKQKVIEAYKLDELIVSQLDPLKFLKILYSLPEDVKSIISYWCRYGTLIGVCVEGILTPSGSVLLDLTTYKRAKSIVDLPSLLEYLKTLGICIVKHDLVYIPGFFYFSDHVALTSHDELFEKKLDEAVTLSGDLESSRLHVPLPRTVIVDEKATLQEAYADTLMLLGRYFFSEIVTYVLNFVSVPSVTPIVLEVPVDLVVITKHDIIAHRFVNIDKTFRRGLSSVTKYSEYGFDKIVLVHYSENKLNITTCRSTLISLLSRPLLRWVGYVVVKGYEIDELIVLKVPTYNRAVELYGSRGQQMKSLIRSYLRQVR